MRPASSLLALEPVTYYGQLGDWLWPAGANKPRGAYRRSFLHLNFLCILFIAVKMAGQTRKV